MIGETGTASLSGALKSNTTLTKLNLWSENLNNMHTNGIHKQPTLHNKLTDNRVGDTGATSLSDALKTNTTLTELNLLSFYTYYANSIIIKLSMSYPCQINRQ